MATTSFSSVGSGIDFGTIADSIVAQKSGPITLLAAKKSTYQGKSDALKALNTRLITLTEAARTLTDQTIGGGKIASASDATVLTAAAAETAVNGSITVGVTRIASSLTQTSRGYGATSTPVLAGGATTATFELRKGGATTGTAITIDSSNNTLAGLRDAINAANAGVTASIVDVKGDGTQNQLVLSSTATGTSGRVELVETTATGTGADLGLTSVNPPGATSDFSALDAQLTINGVAITRSTNSVSDAVAGLTLNLKTTGTSKVDTSLNTAAYTAKVSAFVDAYNAVQDFVATQYKADSSGKPTGVLVGDPTLRSVQNQLRDIVNSSFAGNGGSLKELTQIGITKDSAGKLVIDNSVLTDKLKTSLTDVRSLFSGTGSTPRGFANALLATAAGFSDSVTGTVKGVIDNFTSSIAGLDKSIASQQERLTALRASLTRQFSVADAAIGQLNAQNTALTAALKALEPKSSS